MLMALVASQLAVRTIQPEISLVMVKIPGFPVAHVMAAFTSGAESTFVDIIFLMA